MTEKIQGDHPANERIKALNCLHTVAVAVMDQERPPGETFHAIAGCLPPAWQYPEITCARVLIGDAAYASPGFKKSQWKLSADTSYEGEKIGAVEVYYLKERPDADEGPFLKKERMLIDSVAGYINTAYKRIKLENSHKERIKELRCFYGVSDVVEKYNSDYKKILQGIVDLLPDAWRYPEIAGARIIFKNEAFKTDNYQDSAWKQTADIKIGNQTTGFIEVAYAIEKPALDEGPFLKEERFLLNAVAERLGHALKRIRAEEDLRIERVALENKNIALKEVIERVQVQKNEMAKSVQANVDKLIIPIVSTFEQNADASDKELLRVLKKNLEEITSPFTKAILNKFTALSPVEIQICHYIKNGFSTKDIAQLRGISIATVSRHREHIRKKLNLTNKKINLITYLHNFMTGES